KPAATAVIAELLAEDQFGEDGYEVDPYVTKADDGILAETTVTDPTNGDSIDFWSDGITIWWNGTIGGEPSEGSMPMSDIDGPGQAPQPFCFTPVTAISCLGVALLAACATTINACPDRETFDPSSGIPGGGGGVPEDGGDGDGDSGDGDGKSGGGDGD